MHGSSSSHSEPASPATRLYQQSDKTFGLSLLSDKRKSVPSQTTSVVFESAKRLGTVRLTLGAGHFSVLSTSRRTLVRVFGLENLQKDSPGSFEITCFAASWLSLRIELEVQGMLFRCEGERQRCSRKGSSFFFCVSVFRNKGVAVAGRILQGV